MSVLSHTKTTTAAKGFVPSGRYSYVAMLLQFVADWNVDLPWIIARIDQLKTSVDLASLFRDIITADKRGSRWASHPNARDILWTIMSTLSTAWECVLRHAPDRAQLTLEYLVDALDRLKTATRTT